MVSAADMNPTGASADDHTQPAQSLIDARPILRRTEDNIWDRTERLRSRLYDLIEANCRQLGFEARVLQSDPYNHPAWVQVGSWKPARDGALTARAGMTIHITAMPYHRYEAVYRVEWEKQGRQGVTDQLYAFREHEVREMLAFLWAHPVPRIGDGAARRILRAVQLRTKWWHIWKPRNKVVALRWDVMRAGSAGLLVAGALLLFAGLVGPVDGGSMDDGYPLAEDTTAVTPIVDTILSTTVDTSTALLMDTMMAPTTVDTVTTVTTTTVDTVATVTTSAPRQLFANYEAAGRLDSSDPTFSDTRARYEDWRYYAQAGERIVVTMRSSDFYTAVFLGQFRDGRWTSLSGSNNAAADGMDSQAQLVIPAAGEYLITAAGTGPEQTGSYTIRVDRAGVP